MGIENFEDLKPEEIKALAIFRVKPEVPSIPLEVFKDWLAPDKLEPIHQSLYNAGILLPPFGPKAGYPQYIFHLTEKGMALASKIHPDQVARYLKELELKKQQNSGYFSGK